MKFGTRELLMILTVFLVPVGAYFGAFRPQLEQIKQDKADLEHKREMLEKLRTETARTADLVSANDEIAQSIDLIEGRLPSNKEVDEIVRQVSALAVQSGLAPPSLKSSKPVAAASYREQPLELTTTGEFKGFYDFLIQLERLPRITRLVNMSIERSRDEGLVDVDFTLSIYFRDDEGGSL